MRPNSSRDHPLDCGQMIENLFFYRQTIVHFGRNEIPSLYDLADVDVIERLLKFPGLELNYVNSHVAVIEKGGVRSVDSFGLADLDLEKELYQEAFNYKRDEIKSRKFAKKLSRLIGVYNLPIDFRNVLNEQLQEPDFRMRVLVESLKRYAPYYEFNSEDLRFDLEYLNSADFKIHSNIDFEKLKDVKVDTPLLTVINACEDLYIMSEKESEISAPEFNSKIIRLKTNNLVEKSIKSKRELDVFNHFVFDEAWALREAINSKSLHVKAIFEPLYKAHRFREWLTELPDNANLIREYVQKIEEKSVLESIPLRAIRFYLFNGLASIASAFSPEVSIPLTIAANAFDAFLLGNLAKKWKPNQFIETELRPLVKGKNS